MIKVTSDLSILQIVKILQIFVVKLMFEHYFWQMSNKDLMFVFLPY